MVEKSEAYKKGTAYYEQEQGYLAGMAEAPDEPEYDEDSFEMMDFNDGYMDAKFESDRENP